MRRGFSLDQIAQTPNNPRFQANHFTGPCATQDLYAAQSRQFEPSQWHDLRIALCHNAGQWGGGFDEQRSRKYRVARKMAAQKGFILTDRVLARAILAGI